MFKLNSPLSLATGLEALSKVHAARHITTTFSGKSAYTDYRSINLPALPLLAELSAADMAVYRGYHGHEVAHILHTNKSYYNKFVKDNFGEAHVTHEDADGNITVTYNPLIDMRIGIFHRIWNFMEDPMIEKKVVVQFGGLPVALNAVVERVVAMSNAIRDTARAEKQYDPRETLLFALNLYTRLEAGIGGPEVREYLANIPDEIKPLFERYKKRASNLKHTSNVCKFALKLMYDLWSVEELTTLPPEPKKDGPTGGNGDEGNGNGNEKDQDDGQDDNDGDSGSDSGADDGTNEGTSDDEAVEGSSDEDSDAEQGSQGGDQEKDAEGEKEEGEEQEVQNGNGVSGHGGKRFPIHEVNDLSQAVEDIASEVSDYTPDNGKGETFKYERMPIFIRRNRECGGDLVRQEMTATYYQEKGYWLPYDYEKLNPNYGKPLPLRADKEDRHYHLKVDFDTWRNEEESKWHLALTGDDRRSIALLARKLQSRQRDQTERGKPRGRLDASRVSNIIMGDQNVFYKRTASQGFSTAAAVYCDMSGSVRYTKMSNAIAAVNEALGMGNIATQIATWSEIDDKCEINILKEFEDNYRNVRGNMVLSRFSPIAGGGTLAAEAYLTAIQELLQRQEQRKIIFFLQDGRSSSGKGMTAERACRKAETLASMYGVETIGIGIGFDGICHFFANSITTDFNSLAADLLMELSSYFDRQGTSSEVA